MKVICYSDSHIDKYIFGLKKYKNKKYAVYYFQTIEKYIDYTVYKTSENCNSINYYAGLIIEFENNIKQTVSLEFLVPEEFGSDYSINVEALKREYYIFIHPFKWECINFLPIDVEYK